MDSGGDFFQVATRSHHRTTGAESGDEVSHRSLGVAPDFRSGCLVMSLPVGVIAVLVCKEILILVLVDDLVDQLASPVGAFQGI